MFWAPAAGVDLRAINKLPGFFDRGDPRQDPVDLSNSHWAAIDNNYGEGPVCVVVHSFWRYMGPNYARGYWPQIKELAQRLLELLPGLHYTNDCHLWPDEGDPGGVPVDDAWFAEMDALWAAREVK